MNRTIGFILGDETTGMFFVEVFTNPLPTDEWTAVAALGSAAAAAIALGIALRDTLIRRGTRKQRARIFGTSYDMRIGVTAAAALHAYRMASDAAVIDPTPDTLKVLAEWSAHAAGMLNNEDVTRLADAIPSAAEHLAAGIASLHVADQLARSITPQTAPRFAEMRRLNLVQLCDMLGTGVNQLNSAKSLCRREAAIKLGANP